MCLFLGMATQVEGLIVKPGLGHTSNSSQSRFVFFPQWLGLDLWLRTHPPLFSGGGGRLVFNKDSDLVPRICQPPWCIAQSVLGPAGGKFGLQVLSNCLPLLYCIPCILARLFCIILHWTKCIQKQNYLQFFNKKCCDLNVWHKINCLCATVYCLVTESILLSLLNLKPTRVYSALPRAVSGRGTYRCRFKTNLPIPKIKSGNPFCRLGSLNTLSNGSFSHYFLHAEEPNRYLCVFHLRANKHLCMWGSSVQRNAMFLRATLVLVQFTHPLLPILYREKQVVHSLMWPWESLLIQTYSVETLSLVGAASRTKTRTNLSLFWTKLM